MARSGLPGHWPKGFEAPATVQPGFGALAPG